MMKNGKDTGTVEIHGKTYETVALRVRKFRDANPMFTLQTEIVSRDEDVVVMKASILNDQGRLIATGHAEEKRTASQINRTSALENAETSAIGRALAAFGFGGTEFATADEVANAIHQQSRGIHKPTDGAWDGITADRAKILRQTADQVRAYLESGKDEDAHGLLETSKFDSDEKVAIWTLFDSKERRRLKEAAAAELGTQP